MTWKRSGKTATATASTGACVAVATWRLSGGPSRTDVAVRWTLRLPWTSSSWTTGGLRDEHQHGFVALPAGLLLGGDRDPHNRKPPRLSLPLLLGRDRHPGFGCGCSVLAGLDRRGLCPGLAQVRDCRWDGWRNRCRHIRRVPLEI